MSVVPADYEDLPGLVKLARRARNHVVEFDWAFTRNELEQLRRAVFEWSSPSVGRYKCFAARLLAAITAALGDTNTVLVLSEPRNTTSTDCRVSCARDGDLYRLQGHATFDIVFGYGREAADPDRGSHLGTTTRETLTRAVGMLGWDLRCLLDGRFNPAMNALYGVKLDSGPQPSPPTRPAIDVPVHFHGPFSALDDGTCPCLFTHEVATKTGVYLWTVNVGGMDRPWYVGQTRRGFGQRTSEHLAAQLSGQYRTYDAAALSRGEGRYADGSVGATWPTLLPSFLKNFERLVPHIVGVIRLVRFHVAPLDGDAHLFDRVEGAIGRHFKAHPDPEYPGLFGTGIKLPAHLPGDTRIRLALSSDSRIAGLPREILT
jgi:hypothetical protein